MDEFQDKPADSPQAENDGVVDGGRGALGERFHRWSE